MKTYTMPRAMRAARTLQHENGRRLLAREEFLTQEEIAALIEHETGTVRLIAALEACDRAFVNWQIGQIPGRPEDILALINQVRSALAE